MRLPSRRSLLLGVVVVGLVAASYLVQFHVRSELGDPGGALCNVSETITCATSSRSAFGSIGPVPIAVLGLAFYIGAFLLASRPTRRSDGTPTASIRWLHLLTTLGLGYSLFLAGVSAFVLQSLCPVCAVTWGVNLVLWGVVSKELGRWVPQVGGAQPLWLPPMTRPGLVFAAAFMASTGMAMFALTSVQERLPELAPMDAEAPPVPFELLRRAGGPGIGPLDAPILIVEFSDFECPFCSRLATSLAEIKQTYGDRVRVEFRHFPLAFHANARPAAVAAECAHEQGEFWAFHDLLFRHHRELDETRISAFAQTLGLDEELFAACRANPEIHARVEADLEAGQAAGVTGTPVFFINGVAYVGGWPASRIAPVLDALELPAP